MAAEGPPPIVKWETESYHQLEPLYAPRLETESRRIVFPTSCWLIPGRDGAEGVARENPRPFGVAPRFAVCSGD